MKNLRDWLQKATTKEQFDLARRARTSYAYLQHIANGIRRPSAKISAQIEKASIDMRLKNNELPIISRADLNDTCRNCPYYKQTQCGGKND